MEDRTDVSGVGIPRVQPPASEKDLTSSVRLGRGVRRDALRLDRAHEGYRRGERHDDADGARADPAVPLLALAPAEQPLEVARLEVDGPALAFEDVPDPRH